MYSTQDAKHQRGRAVGAGGYCWPSKPDLISVCLLAALQPLANVLWWQYLASETVAVSWRFEWELLWHLLCRPDQLLSDSTSVSFSLCLLQYLLLLTELRRLNDTAHLSDTHQLMYCIWDVYRGGYPKTTGQFGGCWGIPGVVVIPIGQALFARGWGRLVRMPGERAAKHHVAVFTLVNSCKYTCTNTHCKLSPTLAVLCNKYTLK